MAKKKAKQKEKSSESKSHTEAKSADNDTITIRKETLWQGIAGVLAIALIFSVFMNFSGPNVAVEQPTDAGNTGNNQGTDSGNTGNNAPTRQDVSVEGEPSLGESDAPVTLVKFTDFGCPFCQRFHDQTQPQIISNYVESGDVQIVYKDAPIQQLHPNAPQAHEAANCVFDQGGADTYWDYVADLYAAGNSGHTVGNLESLASNYDVDITDCLASGEFESEVSEDRTEAQQAGLRGTPYFLVNGVPISGAQPFSAFQQVIDSELQ